MMSETEVREYLERLKKAQKEELKYKDEWTNSLMVARIRVLLRVLGNSNQDF